MDQVPPLIYLEPSRYSTSHYKSNVLQTPLFSNERKPSENSKYCREYEPRKNNMEKKDDLVWFYFYVNILTDIRCLFFQINNKYRSPMFRDSGYYKEEWRSLVETSMRYQI